MSYAVEFHYHDTIAINKEIFVHADYHNIQYRSYCVWSFSVGNFFFCCRNKSDEEKYGNILHRLSTLLNVSAPDDSSSAPNATASHVQAQVFIVAIFQPLCDIDVTMVTAVPATTEPGGELAVIMANALLLKEQMKQLSVGLMQHIHQQEHNLSSVLPALRTLSMLIYHDYGYYHVKRWLLFFSETLQYVKVKRDLSSDYYWSMSVEGHPILGFFLIVWDRKFGWEVPQTRLSRLTCWSAV